MEGHSTKYMTSTPQNVKAIKSKKSEKLVLAKKSLRRQDA